MIRIAALALALPLALVTLAGCTTVTDGSGSRPAPSTSASTSTPTPTPTTSAPAPPAPAIVSAVATYPNTCMSGQSVTPNLSWQIVNATGLALSVDNAALGNFAAAGSMPMPAIGCTGAGGSVISHTYLLTSTGGTGPAASKTVTVSITVIAPTAPPTSPSPATS
jgi:hypothetical protein